MIKHSTFAGMVLLAASTFSYAADMSLSIDIPKLEVAEYHRPYVATWLQHQDSKAITNLAVWYQLDKEGEGQKWLKDLRQWWRRSGRSLDMPADGFTGATRLPGTHQVKMSDVATDLPSGDYRLYVEVVREVGGRELLNIPFTWPVKNSQTLTAKGDAEVGLIELTLSK
ncbi:MAG: DUF2271 domain-containing protein [Spongiibacteraceae bacterium]